MSAMLMKGKASGALGIPEWKFGYLISKGLIPEIVPAGRIRLIPADKIDQIRERLIREGHIKPAPALETAHVG